MTAPGLRGRLLSPRRMLIRRIRLVGHKDKPMLKLIQIHTAYTQRHSIMLMILHIPMKL
jgi:hypothetical protein